MAQAVAMVVSNGQDDGECFRPDAKTFSAIVADSIDYAILEEAEDVAVVPAFMGWSDIGSWPALCEARGGGVDGNVSCSRAELVDCRNVMTDSDGPRVSVIGMEDVIVGLDSDEVLVTNSAAAQKVGQLAGAKNQ